MKRYLAGMMAVFLCVTAVPTDLSAAGVAAKESAVQTTESGTETTAPGTEATESGTETTTAPGSEATPTPGTGATEPGTETTPTPGTGATEPGTETTTTPGTETTEPGTETTPAPDTGTTEPGTEITTPDTEAAGSDSEAGTAATEPDAEPESEINTETETESETEIETETESETETEETAGSVKTDIAETLVYFDVIAKNGIVVPGKEVLFKQQYYTGKKIQVTAYPDEGYYFRGWKRDGEYIGTEASLSYELERTSGKEILTAVFEKKKAAVVSAGKNLKFYYDGNAVEAADLGMTVKIAGTTATLKTEQDMTVTWYEGKTAAAAWKLEEAPTEPGTYTAVVQVKETEKYLETVKKVTFTIAKTKLEAVPYELDYENGRDTFSQTPFTITLEDEALTPGQQYALVTSQKAKTADDQFKTAVEGEDLSFTVQPGKEYYVMTRLTTDEPEHYITSENEVTRFSITANDAQGIQIDAPERLEAFAGTTRNAKITITNPGNANEEIAEFEITAAAAGQEENQSAAAAGQEENQAAEAEQPAATASQAAADYSASKVVGKTIKKFGTLSLTVKLSAQEDTVFTVTAKTDSGLTETAQITCEVVDAYSVDFSGTTVKTKTANGKAQAASVSLKAAAADGTNRKISECEISYRRISGETPETQFTADVPKDAGIYEVKIKIKDTVEKYAGETTCIYVLKNSAPAALKAKDLTITDSSVSFAGAEDQEYALLVKGKKPDAKTEWTAGTAQMNFAGLCQGTSYVLYNRKSAVAGDDEGATLGAYKSVSVKTGSWGKFTYKANNKKFGTVSAVVAEGENAGETITSGQQVSSGTAISLTAEPADGYYFSGWYVGKTKLSDTPENFSYTVENNKAVAIQAKFTAKAAVKITFDKSQTGTQPYVEGGYNVTPVLTLGKDTIDGQCTMTYYFFEKNALGVEVGYTLEDGEIPETPGKYQIVAEYAGSDTTKEACAETTLTIKGEETPAPEKWTPGENLKVEAHKIVLDNVKAGQLYLVTTEKNRKTTYSSGWKTAGSNATTLAFTDLESAETYYVYTFIPAGEGTEESSVSKPSDPIRTLPEYSFDFFCDSTEIQGQPGKTAGGIINAAITNTGSGMLTLSSASFAEGDTEYFEYQMPKDCVLEPGETKTVKVTVKKASEETAAEKSVSLQLVLEDEDGTIRAADGSLTSGYSLRQTLQYTTATAEMGVKITNTAGSDPVVVTYNGKKQAYPGSRLKITGLDGKTLKVSDAAITYTSHTAAGTAAAAATTTAAGTVAAAATTTAPSAVDVYDVTVSYEKTVDGITYAGTQTYTYAIRAKAPSKAKVSVMGEMFMKLNTDDKLEYKVIYQFPNGETTDLMVNDGFENGWASGVMVRAYHTNYFMLYPEASGYVMTRVPAVSGDEAELTASEAVKTSFQAMKKTPVSLKMQSTTRAYDSTVDYLKLSKTAEDETTQQYELCREFDLKFDINGVVMDHSRGFGSDDWYGVAWIELGISVKVTKDGEPVTTMTEPGLYKLEISTHQPVYFHYTSQTITSYVRITE